MARIFVTHFHPDHVGAAADVAELTGAPVHQGELDYAQCELVWGNREWPQRIADWFHTHGVPDGDHGGADRTPATSTGRSSATSRTRGCSARATGSTAGSSSRRPGTRTASSACSRTACSSRPTTCSARISPTVGLWPESRPDPLGDFIASLERTIELAPRIALPGHGDPIADPVARAHELIEHHRERLAFTEASLGDEPRSGYEVSFALFGAELKPASRRFAVAETLSHLERLVLEERAERHEDVGSVAYTARQLGRRSL